MRYRETGGVDDLSTVGALHQSEGGVSGFLLVGLLADLTDCRQREARLDEAIRERRNSEVSPQTLMNSEQKSLDSIAV